MIAAPRDDQANPKAALRDSALARRDALTTTERQAAAETIAAWAASLPVTPGCVVSGFMPIRTEIDTLPLMRRLAAHGVRLALPQVVGRGQPLRLRAYAIGDTLVRGQWGLREPSPEAPEIAPDILLVPLLAFDRTGHRLGYGAGYYDRTLALWRARKSIWAVGIAFAAQEVPQVPFGDRDERLDLVLTEQGITDCRGSMRRADSLHW